MRRRDHAHVDLAGLRRADPADLSLLDEIGDMPLALQAKLLRVLQEGEVRRIGATQSRKVDVRVIAATHRDLRESVRAGTFRQDLMFRLEVVEIAVPALRERPSDLPELVTHFLALSSQRHGKDVRALSGEAMARLRAHSWPGNVRELANVVERAVIFASGAEAGVSELPPHLAALEPRAAPPPPAPGEIPVRIGTPLKDVEELLIRKTLEATSGDKNMTAKLLGINQRTIYRKLAEKDPEQEA
jgi:two-component system response regulator HydG